MARAKPGKITIYNRAFEKVQPPLGQTKKTRRQTFGERFGYEQEAKKRRVRCGCFGY